MRANEFITENDVGLRPRVERSLPNTYVIPGLTGLNPYDQYRFGVAMAAATGKTTTADNKGHAFDPEKGWGQQQIVVGYGLPELGKWIDDALKQMGLSSPVELVSSKDSDEETDFSTISPIKPFRGYKK